MASTLPLADGFPTFTEDDWRAAAARVRRGAADAEVASGAREAAPLYPRRSGARPILGRPLGQPWRIIERVDAAMSVEAAGAVSEAVAGGATGIELAFASGLHPLSASMAVDSAPDLATALAVALPARWQIRVDAGDPTSTVVDPFLDLAAARNSELVFTFDPVAARALGRGDGGDEAIKAVAAAFDARGIEGAALSADGRLWHAGGATEEQELGVSLATFVSHARLLDRADRIGVALAADADQFRSIAKFRAMRLLLARVLEIAAFSSPPPRIHAETSWRTLSGRDPHMNVLRATSAVFGAAAGGADSITVLPFDTVAGGSDAGRRLARNTQIILAEEANLFRVADPGAGSGAIEALTATFAEAAWARFQAIEAEGGIVAAIAEGSLLREIAEARETRLARIARGDIKMVGVNAFRGEATAATVRLAPVKRTGPMTFKRLAAPFEEMP